MSIEDTLNALREYFINFGLLQTCSPLLLLYKAAERIVGWHSWIGVKKAIGFHRRLSNSKIQSAIAPRLSMWSTSPSIRPSIVCAMWPFLLLHPNLKGEYVFLTGWYQVKFFIHFSAVSPSKVQIIPPNRRVGWTLLSLPCHTSWNEDINLIHFRQVIFSFDLTIIDNGAIMGFPSWFIQSYQIHFNCRRRFVRKFPIWVYDSLECHRRSQQKVCSLLALIELPSYSRAVIIFLSPLFDVLAFLSTQGPTQFQKELCKMSSHMCHTTL